MRIWKWTLLVNSHQRISIPQGAVFLDVQTQNNEPQLWALVDESAPHEQRLFITCATGAPVPEVIDDCHYVGTYQLHGGALVYHVFASGFPCAQLKPD